MREREQTISKRIVIRSRRDALLMACAVAAVSSLVAMAAAGLQYTLMGPQSLGEFMSAAALGGGMVGFMLGAIACSYVARLVRTKDKLSEIALFDSLTGMLNRRAFRQSVLMEQERMRRLGGFGAALLIDIDHFKAVNDTHGHALGDKVLVAVADLIKRTIRPSMDYVGRWGGEEFVVLISMVDEAGCKAAAERLRAAIDALRYPVDGKELALTVSIGASLMSSEDDLDAALEAADRALYTAKSKGRNKVCMAKRPRRLTVQAA